MSKITIQSLRKVHGSCIPHTSVSRPEYSGWRKDQLSWKETVCIGDWSFVLQAFLEGPEAVQLIKDYSVNSLENFKAGQAKHLISCNKDGKVIGDGILLKIDKDKFCISAGLVDRWFDYILSLGNYKNVVLSYQPPGKTSIFQVAGPNALCLIEEVASESLRDIKFMHFRNIKIGGRDVRAINGLTMAGEIGFELQYPSEFKYDVYDTIIDAGKKYGIEKLGYRSHQINHLEACFPTIGYHYLPAIFGDEMTDFRKFLSTFPFGIKLKISGSYEGNDVSDYCHSPVEMGWVKNINFDHEFLGKEALEEEVAHPRRKIVTLEYNKEDVIDIYTSYFEEGEPYSFMNIPAQYQQVVGTDAVLKDGEEVGTSASPGYSYFYRKMLALAYIDVKYSKPGLDVEVLWGNPGTRQKNIRAKVAKAPYKKDKRKTDFNTLPERDAILKDSP